MVNAPTLRQTYFFLPLSSPRGAMGGLAAALLSCFDLCASLLPDEFFFGFRSPISFLHSLVADPWILIALGGVGQVLGLRLLHCFGC